MNSGTNFVEDFLVYLTDNIYHSNNYTVTDNIYRDKWEILMNKLPNFQHYYDKIWIADDKIVKKELKTAGVERLPKYFEIRIDFEQVTSKDELRKPPSSIGSSNSRKLKEVNAESTIKIKYYEYRLNEILNHLQNKVAELNELPAREHL